MMPWSSGAFDNEIRRLILAGDYDNLLDVGCGAGHYAVLLPEFKGRIDAVEIFEPYVARFGLRSLYRHVFVGDVRVGVSGLDFDNYDLAILGDVLEHMTVSDAQALLLALDASVTDVMVVVPYLYEQGESEGNIHETHLQPDLTPEMMIERYPTLKLLWRNHKIGVYFDG